MSRSRGLSVRLSASAAVALALTGAAPASAASGDERLVHRFLEVQLSPDGAHVAAVEGDSPIGGNYPDVRELVIRSRSGGREVHVALPCGRVPQCWPASPAWAPDGKLLSFTVRTPGSHDYALYSVTADGGALTRRFAFHGTLGELRYAPDGSLALLAIANARKEAGATEAGAAVAGDLDAAPAEQRIAIVAGDSLRWASPADLFVYEYDWRPGGQGFVGTAAPGDGDNNWWTAKLYAFGADAAARVLYAPPSLRQQIAAPVVSRDGRTVAFIAGIMSDFGSTGGDVYALALEGGAVRNLTPDMKATATALEWGCDGKLLARLLAADQTQLVTLGTGADTAPVQLRWSAPETLTSHLPAGSTACRAGVGAVVHESFTAGPEIEVGAIGHWHDLTRSNTGLTLSAHVRSITWSNDGLTAQGWLLVPAGLEGRLPLITIVHGGPAAAAPPRFDGPGLQASLLARGWAVFRPNPRGSFGQGERFTAANVRDFGYGDLRDILAGIDAVERATPIDEARLGLTGHSYGGFMTMWAVTQTNRFHAAVAGAGISNWQSYYGENGIDQWMLPYFGASVYDDPAVYARSSAINFIKNVRTPTFAYVGERDIECPAPQTVEFWHALRSLGAPTAVMIYPGEGHALRDPAHAADALQRTLEWFDRYLR